MRHDRRKQVPERGMALPLVLWMIVLGAGLVLSMQGISQGTLSRTGHLDERLRLDSLMEGALDQATYDLLLKDPGVRPYGAPEQMRLDHGLVLRIKDACGRLDVNWVNRDLMEAYALGNGFGTRAAGDLADRVEAIRSRQAQPFATIDRFRVLVPDLSDEAWLSFAQGLTVACPASGVDPGLASDRVKRALARLGQQEARRLARPSARQFYEISVQPEDGSHPGFRRWIALTEKPGRPFVVLGQEMLF